MGACPAFRTSRKRQKSRSPFPPAIIVPPITVYSPSYRYPQAGYNLWPLLQGPFRRTRTGLPFELDTASALVALVWVAAVSPGPVLGVVVPE